MSQSSYNRGGGNNNNNNSSRWQPKGDDNRGYNNNDNGNYGRNNGGNNRDQGNSNYNNSNRDGNYNNNNRSSGGQSQQQRRNTQNYNSNSNYNNNNQNNYNNYSGSNSGYNNSSGNPQNSNNYNNNHGANNSYSSNNSSYNNNRDQGNSSYNNNNFGGGSNNNNSYGSGSGNNYNSGSNNSGNSGNNNNKGQKFSNKNQGQNTRSNSNQKRSGNNQNNNSRSNNQGYNNNANNNNNSYGGNYNNNFNNNSLHNNNNNNNNYNNNASGPNNQSNNQHPSQTTNIINNEKPIEIQKREEVVDKEELLRQQKQKEQEEKELQEKLAQEEARKKQEEEEQLLAAQKAEQEKLAKEKTDLLAKLDEFQAAFNTKITTRKFNVEKSLQTENCVESGSSNIQKTSAFLKKIAQQLKEENKERLISELGSLNLSRYVSEVVNSICEATSKMRNQDIPTAVNICCLMHQRYVEFSKLLIPSLVSHFESTTKLAFENTDHTDDKTIELFTRRRVILRILTELFINGVFSDVSVIKSLITSICVEQNNFKGPGLPEKFTLATSIGSNSSGSYAGGTSLIVPCRNNFYQNALLIINFVFVGGEEILGITKPAIQKTIQRLQVLDPEFKSNYPELPTGANKLLTDEMQNWFKTTILKKYWENIHLFVLKDEFRRLRFKEKWNRMVLNTKGELNDSDKESFETMKKNYEKLQNTSEKLSELMNVPLPVAKEDEQLTRVEEEGEKEGSAANGAAEGKEGEPADGYGENGVWEDEDTKAFYEDLPQLRELVPAVLLGDTDPKGNPKTEKEGETDKDNEEENDKDNEEENKEESKEKEKSHDKEKDKTEKEERGNTVTTITSGGVTTVGDGGAAIGQTIDEWISKLPQCVNRDMIDKASVNFCYLNSKINRKKLVKALFGVNRNSLNLLPGYSRLVATLHTCMKDIAPALVTKLEGEFWRLLRTKDQINIESKIKNIKFLSELVKFKITPNNVIFKCLKECLDDFTHHNIEIACALLETCGRFLYRNQPTSVRTKNMLETMMRLKASHKKNLDNRLDTMVENAYYQCIPPPVTNIMNKYKIKLQKQTPVEKFIYKLLFVDLQKTSVKMISKLLRKCVGVPGGKDEDLVVRLILKSVYKGRYGNIHLIASLVGGLYISPGCENVAIRVVDRLLERIQIAEETNDWNEGQRRISEVKFLGELYNYCMIESNIIFDTLYHFIMLQNEHPELDPSSDGFRIRLICTLLDTCGKYFDRGSSKRRLDRFLVFFQHYIYGKEFLGLETQFMVEDLLDVLRPASSGWNGRVKTAEEAAKRVEEVEREEKEKGIVGWKNDVGVVFDEDAEEARKEEDEDENDNNNSNEQNQAGGSNNNSNNNNNNNNQIQSPDDDDEEEERVEQRRTRKVVEKTPEDDEFERELSKMIRESADQRRSERSNQGIALPIAPSSIFGGAGTGIGVGSGKDGVGGSDKKGEPGGNGKEGGGKEGMMFKVMMRKGTKQKFMSVEVPKDHRMAVNRSLEKEREEKEREEIIKRTLESVEEGREEGGMDDEDGEEGRGDRGWRMGGGTGGGVKRGGWRGGRGRR
eukprot:TRINITY_DN706_c4_g1_i1.p1 TRINITY_DN706_c4_g1~~TRINITY_DN706_c4_g1_i1.p1  ORF type:complete len:1562 (-),score=626.65 TRINITY_DN706_c4_g1_i1:240-4925(-)